MVDVISTARARLPRRGLAGAGVVVAGSVVASLLWSAPAVRVAQPAVSPIRSHVQAAATAAPAAPDRGFRWSTGTMTVGGLQRAWWLAVPTRPLHARLPLALVLHGRGATALDESQRTGLLPEVAAGRLIAAYPRGSRSRGTQGRAAARRTRLMSMTSAFSPHSSTVFEPRPRCCPTPLP